MTRVHVTRWGAGPRVVLVHGSVADGEVAWSRQRPLAERWRLVVPDRPGYGRNAPVERADFEADARVVADLLKNGAHLVGHSYGAVVALLAAAERPARVHSLTVLEPPAFGLARGEPAVEGFVRGFAELVREHGDDLETFLRGFLALVGSDVDVPSPLPPSLERGARILLAERPPWEAEIPLETLARAGFPKLVVSGAHDRAFDAVCDELAERLGADVAVVRGAGHTVQHADGFNERLEEFLLAASDG